MAQGYKIERQWTDTATGRIYEAKVVGKTRRILGIVRVDVPVREGFDLTTHFGNRLSEETIAQDADKLAERLGQAAP